MQANRFVVGLTGGIGCGKTTVSDLFALHGASVIDTDQIAHQLTAVNGLAMPAIRAQFGAAFVTETGAMDRTKMREYVFSDPHAKKQLEAILHPLIRTQTEQAARQAQGAYPLLVIPLLIETGEWRQRVSRVLVVDCPEALQVERVMRRSGLSEAQVRAIIATQAPRALRLAAADDVIENDRADKARLAEQVERLHRLYMQFM